MRWEGESDGETGILKGRLSRLSAASLRINESLDVDGLLQDVLKRSTLLQARDTAH